MLPSNVETPRATPTWRVAQSPWLIGTLTFITFNLYAVWWLGRTWAQIKCEDGDAAKRPVWHALAMLVPIYGYFRFHAHMRAIAGLAPKAVGLQPGAMTVAWILVNVVDYAAGRPESPFWLLLVSSGLGGALFGWAQEALNASWRSLPGGAVAGQAHPLHWVVIALMSGVYVLASLGSGTS